MSQDKMRSANDEGQIQEEPTPSPVDDGLAKIHRMIEDPDSDPSEMARLINLEICTITGHVLRLTNGPVVDWSWRLKVYAIAIKVLQEMREALMDTGFLNKRDVLNLEGEQFLFMLKQIDSWFGKAITAAGFPEETRNNILKQYPDIAAVEEPAMCWNSGRWARARGGTDTRVAENNRPKLFAQLSAI